MTDDEVLATIKGLAVALTGKLLTDEEIFTVLGGKIKQPSFEGGMDIREYIDDYIGMGHFMNPEEARPYLLDGFQLGLKEGSKKPDQYIICSAIHYDDQKVYLHQPKNIKIGFVISGRRHHNCITTLSILCKDHPEYKNINSVQGFITNDDLFVDRREAFFIAVKANQCRGGKEKTLLSEDLY